MSTSECNKSPNNYKLQDCTLDPTMVLMLIETEKCIEFFLQLLQYRLFSFVLEEFMGSIKEVVHLLNQDKFQVLAKMM